MRGQRHHQYPHRMITQKLTITQDTVTPALRDLVKNVEPRKIAEKLDAPITLLVKGNFEKLPPNKQGFPTTNFWKGASRATGSQILNDGLLIYCAQIGVRQRYQGGEIHPVNAKFLTIPARSEAYGKTAREFPNLVLVFRRIMGTVTAIGLAEAASTDVSFGHKRKDGSQKVARGEEHGGGIMFWLKKTVWQAANPDVLPSNEEFWTVINQTLAKLIKS
jgi:hypothetical protein